MQIKNLLTSLAVLIVFPTFALPSPVVPPIPYTEISKRITSTPPKPPKPDQSGVLESKEFTVINPTSGSHLYVKVYYPADSASKKFPAIILVPGGTGNSSAFTRPGDMAEALPAAGFVAVVFDPDGRGKSDGTEDFNGFIHQDGLAGVIRMTAGLPEVDSGQIGLISYSYGVTMASGALARHTDLHVQFFIDWEGPANREDTTSGCMDTAEKPGTNKWKPCTDEAYWAEREAVNFIGEIPVPYLRVQSEKDHVQPDVSNAVDMINAAIAGDVPWVRLNNQPENQTYKLADLPAMIPEDEARRQTGMLLNFTQEMHSLFTDEIQI